MYLCLSQCQQAAAMATNLGVSFTSRATIFSRPPAAIIHQIWLLKGYVGGVHVGDSSLNPNPTLQNFLLKVNMQLGEIY